MAADRRGSSSPTRVSSGRAASSLRTPRPCWRGRGRRWTGDRWPFDPAAIVKTRPTLKSADGQAWSKRVSGNELRDALLVPDPARTAGQFVLIYDDVCTTGTQLDAVAGCLLDQGGAARVEGVVLARAPWRGSGVSGSGSQPVLRPFSNGSVAAGRGHEHIPSPADLDARSK